MLQKFRRTSAQHFLRMGYSGISYWFTARIQKRFYCFTLFRDISVLQNTSGYNSNKFSLILNHSEACFSNNIHIFRMYPLNIILSPVIDIEKSKCTQLIRRRSNCSGFLRKTDDSFCYKRIIKRQQKKNVWQNSWNICSKVADLLISMSCKI